MPVPIQLQAPGGGINVAELVLIDAMEGDDGIWRDSGGEALHVSASDLEKHVYCPLSWHLSRKGVQGEGNAVKKGIEAHEKIHDQMATYEKARVSVTRELTVWGWWFGVTIALTIDAVAWYLIAGRMPPQEVARYLAILSLVWFGMMLLSTILPWRRWFNWPTATEIAVKKDGIDSDDMKALFEGPGFIGGWVVGGKVEAAFGLGAILLMLNAAALWSIKEMTHAGFILLSAAMLWTLLASWRLQRALIADNDMEEARHQAGLDRDTEVAYSDDSSAADLLVDKQTGLRGRPDQIVIVDGQFIPLEQKTGKVPKHPYLSHKVQLLAYVHLVNKVTGSQPPFGVLRYSDDDFHQIDWNEEHEKLLMGQLKEVQRLMTQGGAKRNHERPGKCENCSRRRACPDSLVSIST